MPEGWVGAGPGVRKIRRHGGSEDEGDLWPLRAMSEGLSLEWLLGPRSGVQ